MFKKNYRRVSYISITAAVLILLFLFLKRNEIKMFNKTFYHEPMWGNSFIQHVSEIGAAIKYKNVSVCDGYMISDGYELYRRQSNLHPVSNYNHLDSHKPSHKTCPTGEHFETGIVFYRDSRNLFHRLFLDSHFLVNIKLKFGFTPEVLIFTDEHGINSFDLDLYGRFNVKLRTTKDVIMVDELIKTNDLVFPLFLDQMRNDKSDLIFNKLKSHFPEQLSVGHKDWLVIDRPHSRKLINIEILHDKGLNFDVLDLSGNSIDDQIKIVHKYKYVISAHGAFLSLMCFSSKTVFFEIHQPVCSESNMQYPIFYNLARKCGSHHIPVNLNIQRCEKKFNVDTREKDVALTEDIVDFIIEEVDMIQNKKRYLLTKPDLSITNQPDCSFKSQDREEEFYLNLIGKKDQGVVIEMGSLDGVFLSNSHYFTKCLMWSSILIEGDYEDYKKTTKVRPESYSANMIACEKDADVHWSVKGSRGDATTTRGIVESMAESFKKDWRNGLKDDQGTRKKKCTRMGPMIKHILKPCNIDLWFLDVEGAELEVVKSFDWNDCSVDFIMYEADGHNRTKDDLVSQLIKDRSNLKMVELASCAKRSRCLVSERLYKEKNLNIISS